ncbi:MAG: TraB/GumN family protein [Candidatus Heimdallarchaeota archaeon]|nr:TraB/GumN family protein [Candidatus Heimdallarchaeota archaeon]MCK4290633.1 TraB/GumN family protein [Candidatus Heimdallarchaeota archaeon]
MAKVTIIGITHIDSESQDKVSRILEEVKPDAVCLELDEYRLNALLENETTELSAKLETVKDTNDLSDVKGEVEEEKAPFNYEQNFAAVLEDIGFFESELARITYTDQPGKEMLIAYKLAKKMGAVIFLIDRSIQDISKVLEEEVSEEEAAKFQQLIDELMYDKKIVAKPLNQDELPLSEPLKNFNELEDDEEINLNEVIEIFKDQESLESILSVFNSNFPQLYSILLEDRNVYMSKQILKVIKKYSNIVVVLGYGHVQEISKILNETNDSLSVVVMN